MVDNYYNNNYCKLSSKTYQKEHVSKQALKKNKSYYGGYFNYLPCFYQYKSGKENFKSI